MRKVIFSIYTLLILITGCRENETTKTKSHLQVDQIIRLAQQLQNVQSDTALVISRDAYERSVQEEYASGMARSSQIMGEILYKMGGLSPATKHLNNSLSFYENQQMVTEQATINLLLSKIYQRLDNYTQALVFSLKAKMLFQDVNDHLGMAHVYGNIGHLYEKTQQYDSALHYQKKALNFYSMVGDTLGLAEIHDNLGSIHEDLEDYETAHDHFQMALILNKSKGNLSEATVNLNNIGDTYRKSEDFSNALKYTSEALQMAESAKLDYQIKSACRDLSKIYESLGEPEKALAYINRSYDLNNRIFSEEIAQEIAKTQAVYDLEQKQQRITFLESERIYHQKLVLMYSGGIIVFLLLGGFSFYQQRAKSSKQRKLLETEAVLAKAELENAHLNEQKLSAELENKQLKSDQLQHELELKSKSLTKNALHIIQKNEFLHELRSKLKEVRKGDAETQGKKIKKLIKSIDFSFNLDDDWHEFETVFQQVHADFYEKLKTLYPNLSPAEVRLCAMVRLNLHSKDMSTIMGISQDSLRIARYRLRKKLGLNKGANLYTFVLNIG